MNEKELTFIDILSIASFVIGLQNLELNITQNDLADQTKDIDARADARVDRLLNEIHEHLQEQDEKINLIIKEIANGR